MMPHGFPHQRSTPPMVHRQILTLLKASVRPSASTEASSRHGDCQVFPLGNSEKAGSLKWSGAIGHGWAVGFDNIEPLRNLGGGELLRIAAAKDFIVKDI